MMMIMIIIIEKHGESYDVDNIPYCTSNGYLCTKSISIIIYYGNTGAFVENRCLPTDRNEAS